MGLDVILSDFLIQVLSGLIVASIIGAGTSFYILIKCVHRQATDIALMKKATIVVLSMIAKDTQRLHGDEHGLGDLQDLYKELIKNSK